MSNCVSALNATVAVQRVRSKQSQLEEGKEEPSVLLSQVLNPDLRPSPSGKIWKFHIFSKMRYFKWNYITFLCFLGRVSSRKSRSKRCVSQSSELDGSSFASLSADRSSLGLLQAMLCQVEADLDSLSPDTALTPAKSQKRQGLTGFSVALVSTLGRLVRLLKRVFKRLMTPTLFLLFVYLPPILCGQVKRTDLFIKSKKQCCLFSSV